MNCRTAENLLLAESDGMLSPAQRAALGEHLTACAACRTLQADLAAATEALRADAAGLTVPDADEEWRLLQLEIRAQERQRASTRGGGASVLKWFGAPLAAAAALAMAFYAGRTTALRPADDWLVPAEARAEFVEVADTSATPIVFRDEESGWLVVWAEESSKATTHS